MLLRLVIVAATLGTWITVIAQEPEQREPAEDQPPGVSTAASARPRVDQNEARPTSVSGARLSLVIQADPFEDRRTIEDKIKTFVLPHIEPGSKARVEVLTIDQSTFDALTNLIKHGPMAGRVTGTDLSITPFTREGSTWQITTGDPDLRLMKLKLTTRNVAGKETSREHEVEVKSRLDAPLRFYGAGTYLLKLSSDEIPASCTLTLKPAKGDFFERTIDWPKTDSFFLVRLENFGSDSQRLFQALQDPKIVGERFKVVSNIEPISLVQADLRLFPPPIPTRWKDKLTFQMGIPAPPESLADRVWALFPLTAQQKEAELDTLRQEINEKSYTVVPNYIRRRAVMAAQEAQLTHDAPPRWFELTRAVGSTDFTRDFKLKDVEAWKRSGPMAECWRIVVYEFGEGEKARPTRVLNPGTKTPVYYVAEEVHEFITGLPSKEGGDTPAPRPAHAPGAQPETNREPR